jgi:hypothetical protein
VASHSLSESELEELWIAEAHDRLDAYDRGELEAVDIDEELEQLA